ncbi:MAG TPA: DNA repair exonuclease [Thiobacillaceae bacterium]|nr:DNA repair exonuclease [Thiobacillaceae bacterium]HNU64456.1 DNA repair exonuclease [Thiobacillaceae bacterium]
MIRLLHTADWQIGKCYGQFEADEAALLAEARFTSIEKLAILARDRHVDLVLVAGDVFDTQGVADRTIHRLFHAMRGYAGPWVMIPGNHDAGLAESVWTRAVRLQAMPANVHVCLKPEPLLLTALGAAILPAPLTQRHTHADLTAWFDGAETPAGMVRIGLAHGCVQGILAADIDSANPIAAGRAEQAGLDYLALGDWHGTRQVDARTWYSGTPETDRFRANDSGQALWVELSGPGAPAVVTPVATGQYRWLSLGFALRVASDIDQALADLEALGPADVVRLSWTGQTDLAGYLRLRESCARIQGRVRSLQADFSALRLEPSDADIDALHADGYLGEVIAELRDGQRPDRSDAEGARDALAILAGILHERRKGRAS